MDEHEHDLVWVADAAGGCAWQTCRSCPFRTDSEPWAPPTRETAEQGAGS